MKVFVIWKAVDTAREMRERAFADTPDELRRLQQQIDLSDQVWKSWCLANAGSIITCGNGQGSLDIPASKLALLPALRVQYSQAVGSKVAIGIGGKLSEAQRALKAAELRGGDVIVLYTDDLEDEIAASEKKDDTLHFVNEDGQELQKNAGPPSVEEIERKQGAEGALHPGQYVTIHNPGPDIPHTMWRRPARITQVHENIPIQVQEVFPGVKKQPANPTLQSNRGKTLGVSVMDEADGRERHFIHVVNHAGHQWFELKGERPCAPCNGSGSVGAGLPCGACEGKGKIEHLRTANPQELAHSIAYASEAADRRPSTIISADMKLDTNVSLRHEMHIPHAEEMGDANPMRKQDAQNQGQAAGFGGFSKAPAAQAPTPAATEASEHSQGEAAHAMLEGSSAVQAPEMTHAAHDLENDFHSLATSQQGQDLADQQQAEKAHEQIKAQVAAVLQSVKAQAPVLGQLKGAAPEAFNAVMQLVQSVIAMAHELSGATAAPQGTPQDAPMNKALKIPGRKAKEDEELNKGALPMPKATPKRHNVVLPPGSVKEGGPNGNPAEVGRRKIQHGDGSTSWVQARAGQVTAVADRHAKPLIGQAGHPLSARNPTGH